MQFTFMMRSHTFCRPFCRPSEYATPTFNPCNTINLTFLATILCEPWACEALKRAVPWEELAGLLTNFPCCDIVREPQKVSAECNLLLMSGCKPLPEEWCIRDMGNKLSAFSGTRTPTPYAMRTGPSAT